jgi:uncharacterized membrane protein YgcG
VYAIFLGVFGIPVWIAWVFSGARKKVLEQERAVERAKAELRRLGLFEEEAYQEWLSQRRADRVALEKERIQIENLSSKALARFVADLPSVLCGVKYLVELAERQLPNGSPQLFWGTISRLDGMLVEGIPGKVLAITRRAGPGRAVEQIESLQQEAARLAERLQSLVARAKGLETFMQEHALHRVYEKRELDDFKRGLIRPRRSSLLGGSMNSIDGDSGNGGDFSGGGGDSGGGGASGDL